MSDFENKGVSPLEGEGIRGDGQAKWYVVHTYSGHENKVKVNIEKMVENRGMQDLIIDIVVPTEDRVEIKDGQRKIKTRKMFPGYVIIKMIVTNESWYLVRNTQGVTGFVGHGSEPIPLTDEEVARMGIEKVYIDLDSRSRRDSTRYQRSFRKLHGHSRRDQQRETGTESQGFYVRERYPCRIGIQSGGKNLKKGEKQNG